MQQMIKRFVWLVLLAASVPMSWGFSLLGPLPPDPGGEPWQVGVIGYDLAYIELLTYGGPEWLGDIGGPHNIGEGYRRNAPILYYSYDASFNQGDFFGVYGQNAIDGAFTIMNTVTNVDQFSLGLNEFPLNAQHYNPKAMALYLTDIKSATLHLLVEQMGLADPARFSWTLHSRVPGPKCPITTLYQVVQRNFDGVDLISLQNLVYSAYVNGALLSYYISEDCVTPFATTVPYLTDPEGQEFIPVAANNFQTPEEYDSTGLVDATGNPIVTVYGLEIGGYYNNLTRDDVAGLRYLMTTNNADVEHLPATSLVFTVATNFMDQELFPGPAVYTNSTVTNSAPYTSTNGGFYVYDGAYGYGDYGAFLAAATTNSPAMLQALYPGLVISSSSNYFVLATNWTYTQYFTNSQYGSTYPPPLTLVTVSNGHPYLLEKFVNTFANVVPDKISPTTVIQQQTTIVQPTPGQPYPAQPQTNVTTKKIVLNTPSGDFFIFPLFFTNVCPLDFLYRGLTNVTATTNFLTSSQTNVVTATNSSAFSSSLIQISYFTNYTWVIHPVTCSEVPGAVGKYRGIGGVRFIRDDTYDYLLGQFIIPVTNYYSMTFYNFTNNLWQTAPVVRVVTQPDIILESADQAVGSVIRDINFNSTEIVPGLHGPGTIDGQSVFTYNRVGSVFENGPFSDINSFLNPNEVNETTQIPLLQWASYDGSTNDPIVYPNGTSLLNLENQVTVELITIPAGALVGGVGLPYSVQYTAVGGAFTPQFTWSAGSVPGEAGSGLPPGLSLSDTGLLSGTPTVAGTYDFTLQLTDIEGRSVQWIQTITINP